MFTWFKLRKELSILRSFKKEIRFQYEEKKQELLELHRSGCSVSNLDKKIAEINVLANLLKEELIDEKNISNSLLVYPSKLRK